MLKGLSLSHKMILGGIIAVFIPLVFTSSIIYLKLSHSLQEIFRQRSVQLAKDVSAIIEITFMHQINLISAISADKGIIEPVAAEDFLLASEHLKTIYTKIIPDYLTILIADKNGKVRVDARVKEPLSVDISDREYFMQAKNGKTGIEGPIVSRLTGELIFIIAKPLYDHTGFFSGEVILLLDIEFLVKMASSVKAGKTGYAFIIDREGVVIVHPQKELLKNLCMYNEPGMEVISARVKNHETGAERYTFRGIHKIAGYTPVEISDWTVLFTQNREEIMEPVNSILFFLLIGGCLFLVLTVSVIIVLSKRISSPVQKLMNLLKQLTLHSENVILNIGLDRKIIFANEISEKIMGTGRENLIGSEVDLTNVNNIPPEDIWKELKSGKTWSGNVIIRSQTPETLTLSVLIIPVIDDSGTLQSYLEIARDITEELKLQARLIQSQKMEALGAMAGGIAHDFNNMLTGILGYSELSLLTPGNPSVTESNLREIMKVSERARDLISQILTFSRKSKQELHPIIPKHVIKEAVKLMKASVPPEIEIKSEFKSDSVIMADPIQLHQIIVNLCTNAVHAIGKKNGAIEITLEDMLIDQEFSARHPGMKTGKHVMLRITDSGKGIEPEILEKIFEPFFTTKPQGEGTGLGLSVVHGIVQKLNGSITVYSRVGQGSVFNILIPAAIDGSENGSVNQSLIGGTERILLVDDHREVLDPLKSILINLGYKVFDFTETEEALDAFKNNPDQFDLVITDYSMPHMTGIEMAEKVKKIRQNIPVIINSGYIHEEITELAEKIGVFKLMTKPVNTFQLAEVIRKAFLRN